MTDTQFVKKTLVKITRRVYFFAGQSALALFGCLVGNLLALCLSIAEYEKTTLSEVFSYLDLNSIGSLMVESFHPMDTLFYGLALDYGYKLSMKTISEEEMSRLMK